MKPNRPSGRAATRTRRRPHAILRSPSLKDQRVRRSYPGSPSRQYGVGGDIKQTYSSAPSRPPRASPELRRRHAAARFRRRLQPSNACGDSSLRRVFLRPRLPRREAVCVPRGSEEEEVVGGRRGGAQEMGAARGLARVLRDALAARMTCPLCRGLLREATAITQCLHTCEFSPSPSLPLRLSVFPCSLVLPRCACLCPRSRPRRWLPWFPSAAPPPPRGRFPPAVSRRVAFVSFGFDVGFFSFSRSSAPGDRAGVRCEFFDPRRVANAPPSALIVALVPRLCPWWPTLRRVQFAFACPWPALL